MYCYLAGLPGWLLFLLAPAALGGASGRGGGAVAEAAGARKRGLRA